MQLEHFQNRLAIVWYESIPITNSLAMLKFNMFSDQVKTKFWYMQLEHFQNRLVAHFIDIST